jgi:hypothetical protein
MWVQMKYCDMVQMKYCDMVQMKCCDMVQMKYCDMVQMKYCDVHNFHFFVFNCKWKVDSFQCDNTLERGMYLFKEEEYNNTK